MFLVNENGIILTVNAHRTPQAHVTSHNELSAAPLHASLGGNKGQVARLSAELEIAKLKIKELESQVAASMEEVESLKVALVKQKQKVKRLWKESCDLSLAHEDEVDLKVGLGDIGIGGMRLLHSHSMLLLQYCM